MSHRAIGPSILAGLLVCLALSSRAMPHEGSSGAAPASLPGAATGAAGPAPLSQPTGPTRTVAIRYAIRLGPALPGASRIDAWIPYPQDSLGQKVRDLRVTLPAGFRSDVVHDSRFGNKALHVFGTPPAVADPHAGSAVPIAVTLDAVVTRHEVRAQWDANGSAPPLDPAAFGAELRPDKMGPLLPEILRLTREAIRGRETLLDRARGMYEKVLSVMRYDKSGDGWGKGDLVWVCDARRGNCTDFHSLFAAMARSEGIPVRFELGLSLPPRGQASALAGYHCWAYFFLPREGWVPVDISEAWKHPERRGYFFGSLDQNRVALTVGRDIHFPGMSGPPINIFFSPYIEIDGTPFKGAELATSFTDLDPV